MKVQVVIVCSLLCTLYSNAQGRVGVGTTDPQAQFDVHGSAVTTIRALHTPGIANTGSAIIGQTSARFGSSIFGDATAAQADATGIGVHGRSAGVWEPVF